MKKMKSEEILKNQTREPKRKHMQTKKCIFYSTQMLCGTGLSRIVHCT